MPAILILIVWLAIIGALLWAITTYIPMPTGIKRLIIVVGVIACVFMVLNAFGISLGSPPSMKMR